MNETVVISFDEAVEKGVKGKSGTEYFFNSELSTARYQKSQEWLLELQFGMPVTDFVNMLDEQTEAANNGKLFDVCIINQKMRDSLIQLIQRNNPAAKLFCLYFNSLDEDASEFNEAKILKKVEDLNHYSYYSFFGLVLRLLNIGKTLFKQIADSATQDILQSQISSALNNIKEKQEETAKS